MCVASIGKPGKAIFACVACVALCGPARVGFFQTARYMPSMQTRSQHGLRHHIMSNSEPQDCTGPD